MTIKQLIKLEDRATEVWVISPSLHYDTENSDFSELVSVNLGQKTKYRYIVPATAEISRNMKKYQKIYGLSDQEMGANFLLLPPSEFTPFITECAIYNASTDCIACTATASEDNKDVIRYGDATAKAMAKHFKAVWRRYKRQNP